MPEPSFPRGRRRAREAPHHKKQADAGPADLRAAAISLFADRVLAATEAVANIAIGPVVWNIEPGSDARHWYFVVASVNAQEEFRVYQFKIASDDLGLAEQSRCGLLLEFVRRRSLVIHEFDDELRMARFCEALCPCDRTRRIRTSLERELAERVPQ